MFGFVLEIILVSILIICCFIFILKRIHVDKDSMTNPSMELSISTISLMICIIILFCIIIRGIV